MQKQTNNPDLTIVLAGGGSGGHITPLLAVANELKKQRPGCQLIYIGETGGKFFDVANDSGVFTQTFQVRAGKFRRYHNQSWLARVFAVKTNLMNLRDAVYVLIGIHQSKKILRKLKPQIIFIKGGFVGVPVGKAAAKLNISYITHDSDALPGLANRLIAKKALWHAVGMPKEFYSYPPDKTIVTGTPVRAEFELVTDQLKAAYRQQLGLPTNAKVVLVAGGSLGAQRLNAFVQEIAESLLSKNPSLVLIHQLGQGNTGIYSELSQELQQRLLAKEFFDNMNVYSGAADLVITRAGATTIAELAVQAKPTILVPNPVLTGGHQMVNAKLLSDTNAVKIITEEVLSKDPGVLQIATEALLNDSVELSRLAKNLHVFGYPDAALNIANLLLKSVSEQTDKQTNTGTAE